ncbi:MAG: nitrite reductase small subunit NirD [Acidimicrobiales bacterium]|nr:nitrite reductase small subunit NirD [Acidimicrobiales bacterium]
MTGFVEVCRFDELTEGRGVAALVGGEQIAIFRLGDSLYAVGNRDPFSGANVLARGLVGSIDGVPFVASPIYKHRFDLTTGVCLSEPSVRVAVFAVCCRAGLVCVDVPSRQAAVRNDHDRVTVG